MATKKKVSTSGNRSTTLSEQEAVELLIGAYPRMDVIAHNAKAKTFRELTDSIASPGDEHLKAIISALEDEAVKRDGTVSVSLAVEILKTLVDDTTSVHQEFATLLGSSS